MPPPLHSSTILPTAPHPSWLTPCHLPPGEGESQRGRHTSATSDRTPPQSRRCRDSSPYTPGAFLSRQPLRRFFRSIIAAKRAGHAAAPTFIDDTAYRPSSVMAYAMPPSPRGRLISEGPAPPTRREPFLCLNSAKTPEGGPPVLVHFLILQRRLLDFCVSSGVF